MNLNSVSAEIRPRKPWEAADLGILMARQWWWPLTRMWLLITLPPLLLLHCLPASLLWLPVVVMWWLKPIWERPLLYILSQALFGHLPDTRETLSALPAMLRRHWLGPLTWLRLSPSRSMDLPVSQLEHLSGAQRRNRVVALHREDAAPAGWLTIIGVHIETILLFSAYSLIYLFIPAELDLDYFDLLQEEAFWLTALQNTLYYLSITLVAPFYVACGFAIYLNRRIKLEGWDIEIAFRRIVQARNGGANPSVDSGNGGAAATVGAAALCCALLLSLLPAETRAQADFEAQSRAFDSAEAQQRIEEILAAEDFHRRETVRFPKLFDDENEIDSPAEAFPPWLRDLLSWLAASFEAIIWALVLALALIIAYRYRRWILQLGRSGAAAAPLRRAPATLFGLDVSRESLPDDVAAAALSLWHHGRRREAMALLYRAALAQLVARGLELRDGSTEGECVRRVRKYERPDTADYFATLTQLWQGLAYGHREPSEQQINRLCQQWRQCFGREQADAE